MSYFAEDQPNDLHQRNFFISENKNETEKISDMVGVNCIQCKIIFKIMNHIVQGQEDLQFQLNMKFWISWVCTQSIQNPHES